MVASARFLELLDRVEERVPELAQEMRDLHEAKGAGYSGAENPDTFANFREAEEWGISALMGCLVRMGDKYKRVQSLTRNRLNEQVGEPRRLTLIDLAAYALIAVVLEEEEDVARERAQPSPPRCETMMSRPYGEFRCLLEVHEGYEHEYARGANFFCGLTKAMPGNAGERIALSSLTGDAGPLVYCRMPVGHEPLDHEYISLTDMRILVARQ